jgi:ribonucleoside-diphosphate reductase beta chain
VRSMLLVGTTGEHSMDLQDVQELSNFFERRVSAYQVGVTGEVSFDDDF